MKVHSKPNVIFQILPGNSIENIVKLLRGGRWFLHVDSRLSILTATVFDSLSPSRQTALTTTPNAPSPRILSNIRLHTYNIISIVFNWLQWDNHNEIVTDLTASIHASLGDDKNNIVREKRITSFGIAENNRNFNPMYSLLQYHHRLCLNNDSVYQSLIRIFISVLLDMKCNLWSLLLELSMNCVINDPFHRQNYENDTSDMFVSY